MWNPVTNSAVTTHDVIWMKQMFSKKLFLDEDLEVEPIAHATEAKDI